GQIGEQPKELPIQSTLEAEDLVSFAVGSSISLASPDAGRMIRLAGFSALEPDGRWTDGNSATITLRLANPTSNGCLRLYFTPFVTPHTGQSIRVKCGDGKELTRSYSAGPRREAMLDLPLSGVKSNGDISISITIDAPNSPASVGLGADERRLGIQLHRLEFVTSFSRVTSTARWALSPFFGPVRRLLSKPRNFLIRPLIERLGQVENQIREHQNSLRTIISDLSVRDRSAAEQLNVLRVERARLINEEFAKQRTQLNAVRGELARLTREEFAKQATQLNALQAELVQVTNEFTKQATKFYAVHRALEALQNR